MLQAANALTGRHSSCHTNILQERHFSPTKLYRMFLPGYIDKQSALVEKCMERHKEADVLFQMQVITLFKRLLTYEPEKVARWLVYFCPRFVKNLGQDIDYNILLARSVTKLIKVSHGEPELLEVVSSGCNDLFKLIIKKFTWKSKYTFVSYDDKPSHEIEINPELFCVFVTCSYSCCSLPSTGIEYLSLINTRLEKLNNEALMKMLTENDSCLIDFLLRNLNFVLSKTFCPTVGKLLPMHPNEAHKEFLISTKWSSQLIIDYLIGEETKFLEYFMKFLKYHEINCNLVLLTNQSCCFASHFDEIQRKLSKMNSNNLIPYNLEPLLNRLTKVLNVCSKKWETGVTLLDDSQNSETVNTESSVTPVPVVDNVNLYPLSAMTGDHFAVSGNQWVSEDLKPSLQGANHEVLQDIVSDVDSGVTTFGSLATDVPPPMIIKLRVCERHLFKRAMM